MGSPWKFDSEKSDKFNLCMRLQLIYQKGLKKSLLKNKMVFSWFSSSSDSTDPTPETERSGYECAPYTILESNQDYEVRRYPERKWATVVYEKMGTMGHNDMPLSSSYNDQPQNGSFMKLFRYISGANEPGSKISMTVSVATKVTMDSNDQGPVIREEWDFMYLQNIKTQHLLLLLALMLTLSPDQTWLLMLGNLEAMPRMLIGHHRENN